MAGSELGAALMAGRGGSLRRDGQSWRPGRRLSQWLMWLGLVAYLVGLSLHGSGFSVLVDGYLSGLSSVLPAVACWTAWRVAGPGRREVMWLALGVTAWAVGDVLFIVATARGGSQPTPSASDVGYLLFYPGALVAVAIAARRELKTVRPALWLDSCLGALAAAAVLSVVLEPVFAQATGGLLTVAVTLAYPIFDLLLIAAVVGVAALQGLATERHWLPLLVGLGLFTAADIIFALRVSNNTYAAGTLLDGLWAVGLAGLASWAATQPRARATDRLEQPAALAVPALGTAAGLAVVVVGNRVHIPAAALVLGTLTLLVSAARAQVAFRQLKRVADLRRQATTDDLTGLPNRRAFYQHVTRELEVAGPHALLLMDLDKFKEVNDSLGHHVGDQLLCQVGVRLRAELRDTDLFARLGGDEFAVLLSAAGSDQAVAVADKLAAALTEPFALEGIAVRTNISIGLALSPSTAGS